MVKKIYHVPVISDLKFIHHQPYLYEPETIAWKANIEYAGIKNSYGRAWTGHISDIEFYPLFSESLGRTLIGISKRYKIKTREFKHLKCHPKKLKS